MRSGPDTGNAASRGASRSGSDDIPSTSTLQPMTYFMATEETLDRIDARGFQPHSSHPYPHPLRHTQKYGVDLGSRAHKAHRQAPPSMSECTSISWPSPSLVSQPGLDTPPDLSRPMTPVLIDHCLTESASSFFSSPRSSLPSSPVFPVRDGSAGSMSQTPQSGAGQRLLEEGLRDTVVPQFIMPSVPIPRRRPFSDAGKSLGKLKVLVAGQAGLGKSSLISSLAQTCKHIVHMDSLIPAQQHFGATESFASTQPCPWWQAESEPSNSSMKRRRSLAPDEILDRNLCFVECSASPRSGGKNAAVGYVEAQLSTLSARPMNDEDLRKLIRSGSESVVDVVLYMLPHTGPGPADIAELRALQSKTNIIPLLARVDEVKVDHVRRSLFEIKKALDSQNIEYFSFATPSTESDVPDVYAVSNSVAPDEDVMDASILMNSEYERPLISTDLQRLVEDIFSVDGCARLRHSASLKCVSWRRQNGQSLSSALTRVGLEGTGLSPSPLAGNLMVKQEYWRRIEMGSWSESLRQSLAAQRRGETPLLLESGEMVSDMLLARIEPHEELRSRGERRRRDKIPKHQDPLGLLGLAGQLKCNGKQTIELLSSAGVVGFLAAQFSGDRGILPKW